MKCKKRNKFQLIYVRGALKFPLEFKWQDKLSLLRNYQLEIEYLLTFYLIHSKNSKSTEIVCCIRSVYLITYSHADTAKFASRRSVQK